ncbi:MULTISPECIES: ERF family protein [Pseudomonas]|uniref:ERF superfamily protein n=1 Tax=Pseudomonas lutea TaxID=243924 RepID=A0A9X8MH64_9PSED|nr:MULTISPECIES: ERF family protein [Pseudomonas]SER37495.1 ERF superfamily protein [Pseudomonas lutea]
MQMSPEINELAKALAAAQVEIENATKDSVNPHFRSKYADLAEVLNTSRPVLAKHGLSVVQMPSFQDGKVGVTTLLMHASGQFISSELVGPCMKVDPQGIGSAITYYRRYSLAAFAGIAQEDDDGNDASTAPNNQNNQNNQNNRNNRNNQGNQNAQPEQQQAPRPINKGAMARIEKTLVRCSPAVQKKFAQDYPDPSAIPQDGFQKIISSLESAADKYQARLKEAEGGEPVVTETNNDQAAA